jgi:hypothetical protein
LGVPPNWVNSWKAAPLEQRLMVVFEPALGAMLTFTVTVAVAGLQGAWPATE